jgi:transcriptional regulator with XRE-family HTH domain
MAGWEGSRLRALRQASGLSQAALATKAGVRVGAVTRWERGTREPMLAYLEKLAVALGVSIGALMGEAPVPTEPTVGSPEPTVGSGGLPVPAAAPPPTPPPALPSQAPQEPDRPRWVYEMFDLIEGLGEPFLRTLQRKARQYGMHPADMLVEAVGG